MTSATTQGLARVITISIDAYIALVGLTSSRKTEMMCAGIVIDVPGVNATAAISQRYGTTTASSVVCIPRGHHYWVPANLYNRNKPDVVTSIWPRLQRYNTKQLKIQIIGHREHSIELDTMHIVSEKQCWLSIYRPRVWSYVLKLSRRPLCSHDRETYWVTNMCCTEILTYVDRSSML